MGNLLSYEIMIPLEWITTNPDGMWSLIVNQLGALIVGGEPFDEAIITINNLATLLQTSHENLSWWFRVPGDLVPSPTRYSFSGDLLVTMYPELYNKYIKDAGIVVSAHNSIGQELRYGAIIPNEWMRTRNIEEIINIIFQELCQRLLTINNYEIDGSKLIID
ncbi:uncharacterized protein LOC141532317 [Cotesia typhae]|uniref:uncharacterized protein LOC141532317 n=1 Tax=Cotesia typhae TaxID=2053667 RepID=UPI003D68265A